MEEHREFEFKDYIFEERVDIGGFAKVYKGRLKNPPNWEVALKVLKDEYHAEAKWRDQFLKEAEILRNIDHTNVVHVDNVFGDDSIIVMKWLDGKSLDRWHDDYNQPDIFILARIALQMCQAIEAVHSQQIAHHELFNFVL